MGLGHMMWCDMWHVHMEGLVSRRDGGWQGEMAVARNPRIDGGRQGEMAAGKERWQWQGETFPGRGGVAVFEGHEDEVHGTGCGVNAC